VLQLPQGEKKGDAVSLKDAMHTKCKDCHSKDATKKARRSVTAGHKK